MSNTTSAVREIRIAGRGLRSEETAGKPYLTGYAATYNNLSSDLGDWRERITPGTFTRAIREKQDVRYLVNHDPSKVLGRTTSGTLSLTEDSQGLRFRCSLPDTSFANDLLQSVNRGDITQCSFGFRCIKDSWTSGPDGEGGYTSIRELRDVDLLDVSTVTFPAYPGTITAAASRSLMFDGAPAEVRKHIQQLMSRARGVNAKQQERVDKLLAEIEEADARAVLARL